MEQRSTDDELDPIAADEFAGWGAFAGSGDPIDDWYASHGGFDAGAATELFGGQYGAGR